jgi:hypothetical protein
MGFHFQPKSPRKIRKIGSVEKEASPYVVSRGTVAIYDQMTYQE